MGGLQTGTSASWCLRFKGGLLAQPLFTEIAKDPSQHAVGLTRNGISDEDPSV